MLTQSIQDQLTHGLVFDPSAHDLYRVPLAFPPLRLTSNRDFNRMSIEKAADMIMLQTEAGHERIILLGHAPWTTTNDGRTPLDFSLMVGGEGGLPGTAKLQVQGTIKGRIHRTKAGFRLASQRNSNFVYWVWYQEHIRQANDYESYLLCSVPKDLSEDMRYLRCTVDVWSRNRELGHKRGKVHLVQSA